MMKRLLITFVMIVALGFTACKNGTPQGQPQVQAVEEHAQGDRNLVHTFRLQS